jgi:hypothetical protein
MAISWIPLSSQSHSPDTASLLSDTIWMLEEFIKLASEPANGGKKRKGAQSNGNAKKARVSM